VKRALKNKLSGADESIEEYRDKLVALKDEFGIRLSLETGTIVARTEEITMRTELIVQRTETTVNCVFSGLEGIGWCQH
jgi:hypothetical protein